MKSPDQYIDYADQDSEGDLRHPSEDDLRELDEAAEVAFLADGDPDHGERRWSEESW